MQAAAGTTDRLPEGSSDQDGLAVPKGTDGGRRPAQTRAVVFIFCPAAAGNQSTKNKKDNSRGEERIASNQRDRQDGAPFFLSIEKRTTKKKTGTILSIPGGQPG